MSAACPNSQSIWLGKRKNLKETKTDIAGSDAVSLSTFLMPLIAWYSGCSATYWSAAFLNRHHQKGLYMWTTSDYCWTVKESVWIALPLWLGTQQFWSLPDSPASDQRCHCEMREQIISNKPKKRNSRCSFFLAWTPLPWHFVLVAVGETREEQWACHGLEESKILK